MEPKVGILIWDILSRGDVMKVMEIDKDILMGLKQQSDLSSFLVEALHISDNPNKKKQLILLDLYYYTVRYSLDHDYSPEQISALVSILSHVHTFCMSTPFDNLIETKTYLHQLLIAHSVNHIPFSIALFSPHQCSALLDYFALTYFAHYHMYKYVYTNKPVLELLILNIPPPTSMENNINPGLKDHPGNSQQDVPSTHNVTEEICASQDSQLQAEAPLEPDEQSIIGILSTAIESKMEAVKLEFYDQMKSKEEIIESKLSTLEKSFQLSQSKK